MTWDNIRMMAVLVGITIVITFLLAKPIGAYQLGESYARNMGVNVKALRVVVQFIVCLRHGICRSDFFCRNRGSTSGSDGNEDSKTADSDSGLFSCRCSNYPVL